MPNLSEAFMLIIEVAEKDGISKINKLPGCWEREIPNGWRFHVNGHKEKIQDSRGVMVPAFEASIWKGDDLAGIIGPTGGVLCGAFVNSEDEFIDALQDALK